MGLKERIKKYRKLNKLTLEEVAKGIGVSKQTVQKYENGIISNIPSDRIEDMAKMFGCTPADLMGWEDSFNSGKIPDGFFPLPIMHKKPRLGTIVCGEPIESPENFEGYDDVPENIHCDFTLKCEGDSMIGARIYDGDIVYIRQQNEVENGQIAAISIDGEKTLKRVYWDGTSLILQPENPKYQPLVYTGAKLDLVRIIGLAVGFTSLIK